MNTISWKENTFTLDKKKENKLLMFWTSFLLLHVCLSLMFNQTTGLMLLHDVNVCWASFKQLILSLNLFDIIWTNEDEETFNMCKRAWRNVKLQKKNSCISIYQLTRYEWGISWIRSRHQFMLTAVLKIHKHLCLIPYSPGVCLSWAKRFCSGIQKQRMKS